MAVLLASIDSNNIQLLSGLLDLFDEFDIPDRVLEDFLGYLRTYLTGFSGTYLVGNDLYVPNAAVLSDLALTIPVRQTSTELFPTTFFEEQQLPAPKSLRIFLMTIGKIITDEINSRVELGETLKVRISDTFDRTDLLIYVSTEKVVADEFERTRIGMFIYLLYLRDKLVRNPDACIIITNLEPLTKQARAIEANLFDLSPEAFGKKYPRLTKKDRTDLLGALSEVSLIEFRYGLLTLIIQEMGPYAIVDLKADELIVSATFTKLLERCAGHRYSVAFLVLKGFKIGHANLIIFDTREKVLERFEPNGSLANNTDPEGHRTPESIEFAALGELADGSLDEYARSIGYQYLPPSEFCPRFGAQSIENFFTTRNGFCVSWSVVYGEERLTSSVSRSYIAKNLLDDIVTKYQLGGRTPEDTTRNIERWIRQRVDTIFVGMQPYYQVLSEYFGVPIVYKDDRLIYA